jgi:hypothetical protein
MSITAKLYIDGHSAEQKGIKVLSFNFGFSQNVDEAGYITSKVRAGLINIVIKATEDAEIVHWMLSNNTTKNGRIEFSGFTDAGALRKIHFKDALLVDYSESFSDLTDILINLTISAREINIAGEKYTSFWSSKFANS